MRFAVGELDARLYPFLATVRAIDDENESSLVVCRFPVRGDGYARTPECGQRDALVENGRIETERRRRFCPDVSGRRGLYRELVRDLPVIWSLLYRICECETGHGGRRFRQLTRYYVSKGVGGKNVLN